METPLLQTKLYIPVTRPAPVAGLRTSLIPRPRLLAQLNEGLPGKMTLLSAPAGFGKTTLISDWVNHISHSVAWLSLDEEDNDFARFLAYVTTALQTIQPTIGREVLALLSSSPLPPSATIITLLINDLAAVTEKFVLVLEDYHVIETATIDQALTFLLDHMPPTMHLVMTSRIDPNLPCARLRAGGQLNELRSADLRFTLAETAQFLAQMTGLQLTTAEVGALDRRTEGWIAGLQMAALSLHRAETVTVTQFIENFSGSHHYIMDYLIDEVLQQQPDEIQHFLLQSSILEQLCGPLCDAVIAGALDDLPGVHQADATPTTYSTSAPPEAVEAQTVNSQLTLEYLEHANLFINPLDEQRHWYRYHPLFADLLRHRLTQIAPAQMPTLHLRASHWYAQAGLKRQAAQHALAAQDFDRAATLLEQLAPAMIQRAQLARLLVWLDSLPADELQARPLLSLYYSWGLFFSGQIDEAACRLAAIEIMVATDAAKQTPKVQGHLAAMRAYLVRETGDLATAITLSRQALVHLSAQDTLLRAMVMLNLAMAHYFLGEFEPASQLLTATITTGQKVELVANTLSAMYLQTQLLQARGALQQALALCQEGLEWVAQHGWANLPAVGFLYVALGDLLCERNELTSATEYLEKGVRLGQAGAYPHILISGHVGLAWLRQVQGDPSGSQVAMHTALQLVRHHRVGRFWPLPAPARMQARLAIAQDNLAAAQRWAQARDLQPPHSPIPYREEADYLTLARLQIAQGDLEAAKALLTCLHRAADAAARSGSLLEILILQAITAAAQDRPQAALSALAQALSLAEPEGFVRIFLDEGPPLVELLRQAVAHDRHGSYALRLLDAAGESATASQPLVEPLSKRELEVLRLIAAGYTNKAIAQALVVAVSTVKRHIANIYGKLEVRNRTQAVAAARTLNLL
ncbi:MAG: LuxR C-terminal-related transcriptional regulator [Caldilineaceae bacterium]